MSQYQLSNDPSIGVVRLLFKGTCFYTVASTFVSGVEAFAEIYGAKEKSYMIFENKDLILGIGLAVGIIFCLMVCYFFKYQNYKKDHPDKEVVFEAKYVVAAVCTCAAAALVSYVITFMGLGYIASGTVVKEDALAFIIALVIGGFTAFVVDACVFHPIVDGTAAIEFNKAQKAVREKLASEETKRKVYEAVAEKARTLGLVDEAKIAMLAKMVEDEDDPSFAAYIQLLLKA